MAKRGRPMSYQSEDEKPVTVLVRIPRDLADQLKRYTERHHQSITEVLLEGLRLRLETPSDPRDIILSDDNTVIRELQEMVDAAVQAALARMGGTATPAPDMQYDNKQNPQNPRQNSRPSQQLERSLLSRRSKSFRLKFARCC
jgi:hypothetical protein